MLIGSENKENEFLGRKIVGEISHYSDRSVEQHNPREFLIALIEIFGIEKLQAVRWEQYTPYFNDGDPCYFLISEPRFEFSDREGEDDYWSDGFVQTYEIEDEVLKEKLEAFSTVIESGHHNTILNEKFGDPAQVTAKLDEQGEVEFHVEYYDHD